MTIRDLARSTLPDLDEEEEYEFTIPSTSSGGGLGSSGDTNIALAAHQYPLMRIFLKIHLMIKSKSLVSTLDSLMSKSCYKLSV